MVKPRISVIIGIYNCAPYLVEALDSLYAQTYQDFKKRDEHYSGVGFDPFAEYADYDTLCFRNGSDMFGGKGFFEYRREALIVGSDEKAGDNAD